MRTAFLFLVAGTLALSACSNGDDADKSAKSGQTATSGAPATAPTGAPAAADSRDKPPLPSDLAVDTAAISRGEALANANCLRCHASKPGEKSKNPSAPSFATLFVNYPPDYIAEAFAEGVFVGHGDMPAFEFTASQIDDLVAYLKTLDTNPA